MVRQIFPPKLEERKEREESFDCRTTNKLYFPPFLSYQPNKLMINFFFLSIPFPQLISSSRYFPFFCGLWFFYFLPFLKLIFLPNRPILLLLFFFLSTIIFIWTYYWYHWLSVVGILNHNMIWLYYVLTIACLVNRKKIV